MVSDPRNINIEDYSYILPDERIAQFALGKRENSRLLLYRKGNISEDVFFNITDYLPENSLLVFNNTKVIPARLIFRKSTGALIEIFCLEPAANDISIDEGFHRSSPVKWKCFIGNAKRWKAGLLHQNIKIGDEEQKVFARKVSQEGNTFVVEFSWQPDSISFSKVLEVFGKIPLPPYISRETVDEDSISYQTVYAEHDGSVAAPTAGLHFTPEIIKSLKKKNIETSYLTLHVGAGTFTPVVTDTLSEHSMHSEEIVINRNVVRKLLRVEDQNIIAVGTTTVRTLESIYWFGVKLLNSDNKNIGFFIEQWEPYRNNNSVSKKEALQTVLDYLDANNKEHLHGNTRLIIAPGYEYKITNAMVTNFHQPRSTLLLLVAAMVGNKWRDAYEYALKNNFRFLSYGDSCLFIP
jgi:S-adenosylmethionine:tRNA ribosyltransferase-isomerase